MKLRIEEFELWLRERGYDIMMGEDNFRMFLNLGFPSLLFRNSNLLFSFIFSKLGIGESERINERVRFEIAKKVKSIRATKDEIEIEI